MVEIRELLGFRLFVDVTEVRMIGVVEAGLTHRCGVGGRRGARAVGLADSLEHVRGWSILVGRNGRIGGGGRTWCLSSSGDGRRQGRIGLSLLYEAGHGLREEHVQVRRIRGGLVRVPSVWAFVSTCEFGVVRVLASALA